MYSVQLERMIDEVHRYDTIYKHVKLFGVDRTLLAIYNYNGYLSSITHVRYPDAIHVPCIGSPDSALSRATIAGIEGFIGKFWDWIANVFKRIGEWFGKIWKSGFQSSDKYIQSCSDRLKMIDKVFSDITEDNYRQMMKDPAKGDVKVLKSDAIKKIIVDVHTKVNTILKFIEKSNLEKLTDDALQSKPQEMEAIIKQICEDKEGKKVKKYAPTKDDFDTIKSIAYSLSDCQTYSSKLDDLLKLSEDVGNMCADAEKKMSTIIKKYQDNVEWFQKHPPKESNEEKARQMAAKEGLEVAKKLLTLAQSISKVHKYAASIVYKYSDILYHILTDKRTSTAGKESIDATPSHLTLTEIYHL